MPCLAAQIVDEPKTPREDERRAVAGVAQFRRGDSRGSVELRDLSPGGARVLALAPLRVGQSVWLKLPTIAAIEARVVWTEGCESGCQFVQPLYPAVFDSLVAAG